LRAVMYGLPLTDRYEVKRIAGRIIPAIATTTATVAGLVSLEVLKYICFSGDGIDSSKNECLASEARNNFINLSLPSVLSVKPGFCDVTKLPNGESFTIWDRWDYRLPSRKTTVQEFIDDIKVSYSIVSVSIYLFLTLNSCCICGFSGEPQSRYIPYYKRE
uniref:ThiF domain-containing protein n=1 Tax=Hymenolepis diminuta TaxID=6216 RepID=A0A0R3S817_HYMDI